MENYLIKFIHINTDWEQMTDFMNLRIQKGDEAAQIEFSHQGRSLSVYGVSVTRLGNDVP